MRRPSRAFKGRSARAIVTIALSTLLLLLAVFGPLFASHAANHEDLSALLQGSSSQHWLGTDNLGRDVLARVIVASRLSLVLSLAATAIAAGVGIVLGGASIAGRGGALFTAVVNILVAFPALLLALFFVVIFGVGSISAALAVGLAMAPVFARLVQTLGSSVVSSDYVSAARLLGLGHVRILVRYVLPNVIEPLLVTLTIAAGSALIVLSELSFLGVGVQSPSYDWGQLLQYGLTQVYTSPGYALGPAAAILIAGLTFNLIGDTLAAPELAPRRRLIRRRPAAQSFAPRDRAVAEVQDLNVAFPGRSGQLLPLVRDVSLGIEAGERIGLVGESGSGKSLTALAIAGLVPYPGEVSASVLRVAGVSVVNDSAPQPGLRGRVAVVFQDATRAFNPVLKIGRQIEEASTAQGRAERRRRALDGLAALKISMPGLRLRQYPQALSGGIQQRAMIAMALSAEAELLIADEPTTALDVTVQRATLAVLRERVADSDAALLFISHDIAVVSSICDRVLVMYAGRIVEELPASMLQEAEHPYTRALLAALPDLDGDLDVELPTIPGSPPAAGLADVGCPFAPRCAYAQPICSRERPKIADVAGGHRVACWLSSGTPSPSAVAEEATP